MSTGKSMKTGKAGSLRGAEQATKVELTRTSSTCTDVFNLIVDDYHCIQSLALFPCPPAELAMTA